MNFFQAIVLGIIEGITEFLPISSTGHLILAGQFMNIPDSNFTKSFQIAIQLGAILSVVFLYWKKILNDKKIWKKIGVAFLPAGFLGFIFYTLIREFLLSNSLVVVGSLFLGGIILIVFELWQGKKENHAGDFSEISYRKAFIIGMAQSVAIIPGVSRSAATIIGGLSLGISRKTIVEFSFLLAVPTMLAATVFDLTKNAGSFSLDEFYVLGVGFVISFFVALLSIKWLLSFIKNHTFISFGIYRIILALIFWFFVI